MKKIRCAVIGVGYLGRYHAQKYQQLEDVSLVAICDVNPDVCEAVSRELNVPAYLNFEDLFDKVDAVSISVPTSEHYKIAKACMLNGLHVLVEKPVTETLSQAKELVEIANFKQIKFQVGHLERFNAARLALEDYLEKPLFIESQRLAPFNPRCTDVNVILDLMIHDIDLIQSMMQCPIQHIDAHGAPVLSKYIDIANARITFVNHCVANVTASRVSFKTERITRIFQANSYISIDLQHKKLAVFNKGTGEMFPGISDIVRNEIVFDHSDALLEEIKAFIHCIRENKKPLVTGEEGLQALETAERITNLINHQLEQRYACL